MEELKRRKLEDNRDNLISIANELRKKHHPAYIVDQLGNRAINSRRDSIIESIRAVREVECLRRYEFYLLAVDADPLLRFERVKRRNMNTDKVTYEQFLAIQEREMNSPDPNKQNLSECMRLADFALINDGSVEELRGQVNEIMGVIVRGYSKWTSNLV